MEGMNTKRILYVVVFVFLGLILMYSMLSMREFGHPQSSDVDDYYIENGQQETGANNIVGAVVFDYRGYDTLGEATILFTAVIGVGLLLSRINKF